MSNIATFLYESNSRAGRHALSEPDVDAICVQVAQARKSSQRARRASPLGEGAKAASRGGQVSTASCKEVGQSWGISREPAAAGQPSRRGVTCIFHPLDQYPEVGPSWSHPSPKAEGSEICLKAIQ